MIDKIQNNKSNFTNNVRIDLNKTDKESLLSKPLFERDQASIGDQKESLQESIGYLKSSINTERGAGKNSVNYDFSHFGKEEDSGLKFL